MADPCHGRCDWCGGGCELVAIDRRMGDLSKNFSRSEFECPDCHKVRMSIRLIAALQDLRNLVRCPVHITSGFRCAEYNRKIGGVANSRHKSGEAAG
jgi:uncharacterized protein YcbK (DUF882 family)